MLIEPLLQLLNKLKLTGMLGALERQFSDPDSGALRFEERLAMLLQHELAERENTRFSQRLRIAALPQPACLEDLDTHIPTRHLDPAMISTVRDLGWIARHLNVLITGPDRHRQVLHRCGARTRRLPHELSSPLLPSATSHQ